MVSFIQFLHLLCAFSLVSSSDLPRYAYKADLSSDNVLSSPQVLLSYNPVDKNIYAEIDFNFQCDLYFNDANDYYIDNLEFTITSALYLIDNFNNQSTYLNTYEDYKYLEASITQSNIQEVFDFDIDCYFNYNSYKVDIYWLGDNVGAYSHDLSSYVPSALTSSVSVSTSILVDYFETQVLSYINNYMNYDAVALNAYSNGYDVGYGHGFSDGEAQGYTEGYNHGVEVDDTAITIFNGILNIALVPINFFLAIFNFEILGINISQLVSALLSICLVIIVVRFVTGKKQGGD